MDDGKVAFLDFGMTKQLDTEQIELEIAAIEAVLDDDPDELVQALHELGFLAKPKKMDAEKLMAHVKAVGGWYLEDARAARSTPSGSCARSRRCPIRGRSSST